ncbi:transmembrane and immunoglobulin domain-containing protein 2 isoform X1 [Meriones unguiculatus]|uniref:transmembrane and immunoglobulin domain-containing protein 2 isoform X1 n=2 Tax=Meriones unguiculatus TaxID=10047 RepID=UPI00293F5A80|nr:transmembrane and immunoglobulin domain-containing protein 2 isoform X1 [Meriones unguiculatus]
MEFSGWALILLQLWGLQEAVSLMVQQQPPLVNVTEGDNVSLSCVVTPSQAWERLRVQWTLNNSDLCHMLISNGSLRSVSCESRRQLFWVPPGNLTLGLDRVSLNESGDYVCKATLEIPTLQEAQGNGTKVIVEEGDLQLKETFVQSGLLLALSVVGGVVAALVVLGVVLWGLSSCHREDSENSLYSNVLHRPRETPHRPKVRPKEKAPDPRTQIVYSTTFPQPDLGQQFLVPKPSPRPRSGHPVSAR